MELLAWSLEPYMVIVTKFMSGGNLFQLIHSGTIDNAVPFVKILRDIVRWRSPIIFSRTLNVHRLFF